MPFKHELAEDKFIPKNPLEEFLHHFKLSFPADGVDTVLRTQNGNAKEFSDWQSESYRYSIVSAVSTFLGLPNRKLLPGENQSRKNIVRNFLGWQPSASKARNIINLCVMAPLNFFTTPFKFMTNVVKLILFVLPKTAACAFARLVDKGRKEHQKIVADFIDYDTSHLSDTHKVKQSALLVASKTLEFSCLGPAWLFTMLTGIGYCIAFPFDAIRTAWYDAKNSTLEKIILTMLAVAVSAIFYGLLIPGAIIFVNPMLVLMHGTALLILGALLGSLFSTIGTLISQKVDDLREKWHSPPESTNNAEMTKKLRRAPVREQAQVNQARPLLTSRTEPDDDSPIIEQWHTFDEEPGPDLGTQKMKY